MTIKFAPFAVTREALESADTRPSFVQQIYQRAMAQCDFDYTSACRADVLSALDCINDAILLALEHQPTIAPGLQVIRRVLEETLVTLTKEPTP